MEVFCLPFYMEATLAKKISSFYFNPFSKRAFLHGKKLLPFGSNFFPLKVALDKKEDNFRSE